MTRAIVIAIALAACTATDLLDGDIEDRHTCCALLTRARVRACVADFVEPGWCQGWTCPTTSGHVCRDLEGEVIDPEPGWIPTPSGPR